MIKFFLNITDNFLCDRLKSIVARTENYYRTKGMNLDLAVELEKLDDNALVGTSMHMSEFEKQVKFNIKIVMGIFFVAVPLFGFSAITYLLNFEYSTLYFEYSYAFMLTFGVAMFSSIRLENIVHRYTQLRYSTLTT